LRRNPASMRRRQLALLLAAVALAACGGDDDDNGNGDGEESGPRPGQAEEAKSGIRTLQADLESCYANNGDYTPCMDPDFLRGAGVPLGSEEGQTEVKANSPDSYTITAHPEGGGEFTLTKETSGATKRECEPADIEGCTNGTW
jgi:hypothetical protein